MKMVSNDAHGSRGPVRAIVFHRQAVFAAQIAVETYVILSFVLQVLHLPCPFHTDPLLIHQDVVWQEAAVELLRELHALWRGRRRVQDRRRPH